MLVLRLAVAGLGIGAIAALAGLGLLATYRLTGVLNLAFGAIAMVSAYSLWWLVRTQGWQVGWAAAVVLGGVCPGLGAVLDRGVFRPLQRRRASPVELLTATVGVFVLLVGGAFLLWSGQGRTDAPSIVPDRVWTLPGDILLRADTAVSLGVVAAVAGGSIVALRTRAGLTVRAVVENRQLAELAGVDTNRVAAVGWILGSVLAGLVGLLLAPAVRLDPYGLTLLVLETMAVVVIARLTRPARAVAAALAIGVLQSELTQVRLSGRSGALLQAVTANLFVVLLLVALLSLRRLDTSSGEIGTTARLALRREAPPPRGWWVPAVAVFAVPLVLPPDVLRIAQTIPALALILVSIVILSGYGGQISLGQAGFAGLGALAAVSLTGTGPFSLPRVSDLLAVPAGAALVVPVGLLAGWPAIRRRGLFLALTTFAVGAIVSRFVFDQPAFVTGVVPAPPHLLSGDDAFYAFELLCLGGALLLVRNLHRGRLGRALLAMRDDEAGARATGIDVTRLKVFLFAVSAAIAGLGGVLLTQSARAFDAATFDPVQSLLWFATVVVFGVDSASGAVLGATVLVTLDATLGPGVSTILVGALAVLLGRIPGGAVHWARRSIASAVRGPVVPPPPGAGVRLSPAGRALAARFRA